MITNQADPIQAQLTAARRNQILDAATQVFAEKGFARATIRQIAQTAGIADGTIYIYFKNKNELMLGLMHRVNQSEQRAEDFASTNTTATAKSPESFSANYFRQRMRLLGQQLPTFQAILQEVLGNEALRQQYFAEVIDPTYAIAQPFFQKLIAEGEIRPFDSAQTMRVMTATALGLLILRMLGDTVVEQQWEALPDTVFDILFNGLKPNAKGEVQ